MKKLILASAVKGELPAPPSKSDAQRAIISAFLSTGRSRIARLSPCDDTLAALRLVAALGATVRRIPEGYAITSIFPKLPPAPRVLQCGESGLLARMIAPVVALFPGETRLEGSGTLLGRPIDMIVEPLRALGATVTTNDGRLPVTITGPLTGGEALIDGSVSSQLLTGLLMALPLAAKRSTLVVPELVSQPYIDLTREVIREFGVKIIHDDYHHFTIPTPQKYTPCAHRVAGDWSGASCLLVAGAIAGVTTVTDLDENSPQADKAILTALRSSGARVFVSPPRPDARGSVTVVKPKRLKPFSFDATECPDLFPALVALAARCGGNSRLLGVRRLVHKESDRAAALKEEYARLGISVKYDDNLMIVRGGPVEGGEVSSRGDHRVAMSLATVALNALSPVTINDADCVSKSYPGFWDDLQILQEGKPIVG
ncbi:MAG: 3-phosphoshikimate 1-carboxyvinyltransferase [Odoribacteraceae bacterium]|jgi:3-phosphoshikimate 1-carboxyvinyltransferase|nr:3-phosphoshikimate 1-carboxyvinyltransferase [Odoribacteraceae bacterium]